MEQPKAPDGWYWVAANDWQFLFQCSGCNNVWDDYRGKSNICHICGNTIVEKKVGRWHTYHPIIKWYWPFSALNLKWKLLPEFKEIK